MSVSLNRVILYVQDVERVANFYRDTLGLAVTEQIKDEWAVLKAGQCEIALHRVGKPYRVADATNWKAVSNAKLVLTVDRELSQLRAELVAKGVPMTTIKSYPPLTGPLCDGQESRGERLPVGASQLGRVENISISPTTTLGSNTVLKHSASPLDARSDRCGSRCNAT